MAPRSCMLAGAARATADDLDRYLDEQMRRMRIPGLAVVRARVRATSVPPA